jgi:hypothetical protein
MWSNSHGQQHSSQQSRRYLIVASNKIVLFSLIPLRRDGLVSTRTVPIVVYEVHLAIEKRRTLTPLSSIWNSVIATALQSSSVVA